MSSRSRLVSAKVEPLRVLHVVSGDLWAGAEVQVYQLLRVACRHPRVELRAVILNPGMLADRLAAAGVAVTVLEESRHGFWALARGIRALARAWQPRVVHTHRRKEHVLGALAASSCGAALVATIHGRSEFKHNRLNLRQRILHMTEQAFLSRAHQRLVAVSDDLAIELPGAADQKVIIPNSVDVAAARQAATTHPPTAVGEAQLHIGFLGRLVPVKQVDKMLKMMHLLESAQPGRWALHIAGDGPLRGQLQGLAVELGLEQSVKFHGFLPNPLPLLAQMDLFLFASAHEGMPMTALEALALGVPIVSPPIGSLVRLIEESGTGAVARSAEPGDLADAVKGIRLLPRSRSALRSAVLPERYRIENGVECTVALWSEVAGRAGD
jgi:L-malate glycosyltransferase